MTDSSTPDRGEAGVFQQFLAQHGGPAFLRRAQRTEQAYQALLGRCRAQRAKLLELVRTRLGLLNARAGTWDALLPFVCDESQVALLRQLEQELAPQLKAQVTATSSPDDLRQALEELNASISRFNRRWLEYLAEVDLAEVNALRDGYNRYYVLEKECAVGSLRIARQGFRRLDPVTRDTLLELFPLLPLPHAAGGEPQ